MKCSLVGYCLGDLAPGPGTGFTGGGRLRMGSSGLMLIKVPVWSEVLVCAGTRTILPDGFGPVQGARLKLSGRADDDLDLD